MEKKSKNDLLKFTGLMGLGGIVSKLLSIPHAIIYAKFLMPSGYGALQIIKTIISYFGYTQLGMLQAMTRNIPKAYSENNSTKAEKIKHLSFSWSLLTTVIGLIILIVVYFFFNTKFNEISLTVFILLIILIILSKINSFIKPLLKAEGEFVIIGKTTLFNSSLTPIVGIVLVYFYSLNGALITLIFDKLFLFIISLVYYNKYKPQFFFKTKLFLEQISKGFLIFLYRFTETSFTGLIYFLVGFYYGSEKLGVFSLGLISLLSVYRYSASIRMFYYREIMVTKNNSDKNNVFYKKLFDIPHSFNLFFNTILLGLFAVVYFALINSFLIKYTDSIPVIYTSIFGLTVYNARTFCAQFLDATNNLIRLTIYIFIGVLAGVLLTIYFLSNEYNLFYIALSTGVAFTVMSTFIIIKAFYDVSSSITKALRMIGSIYIIAAANTAVVYFFSIFKFLPITDEINIINIVNIGLDLFCKVIAILALNYITFSAFFYKMKFLKEFNKIIILLLGKLKFIKKK